MMKHGNERGSRLANRDMHAAIIIRRVTVIDTKLKLAPRCDDLDIVNVVRAVGGHYLIPDERLGQF
jgi:hypothetical protein